MFGKLSSSLLSMAVLGLSFTFCAGATTVVVTSGMLTSPMSGMSTVDFSDGMVPAGFTFSASQSGIVSGNLPVVYAQPAGDNSMYAYVNAGGSITETLGSAGVGVNYFGLYWGSPDAYNTLTFTDTMGNQVVYGWGGIQVPTFTMYQHNPDSYVEFYATGNNWVSATWTSVSPSFEFDNVTSGIMGSPAPEPKTIMLLAGGLLIIGAGALRRRKVTA
jgi:hypothetical protein